MRILLDNCVHVKAKGLFRGHEVLHASDIGFEKLANGELMARAAKRFDVFVTTDKKIRYEHNLDKLPIALVELNTRLTRFDDLRTLEPHLEAALQHTKTHRFVSVASDGRCERLGPRV